MLITGHAALAGSAEILPEKIEGSFFDLLSLGIGQ